MGSALPRLWEALTRRPWTTTRSATAEYGPPPGAVYRDRLAAYRDSELYARPTADILADLRREVTGVSKPEKSMADRVLAKEQRLDPADKSTEAEQVRATAASIRGHRSSPAGR